MIDSDSSNELACMVCGKPKEIPIDKCHDIFGKNNPLCSTSNKCRIAEKTDEQLKYIFSSNSENIFLRACPGSGKTESVGLKAAYEIRKWNRKAGGIAVLTFTNNAADVIADRVTQFAGIEKLRYPHFIGTIDSWFHRYIAHPFWQQITGYKGREGDCSIRLVSESSEGNWLYRFKLDTAYSYYKGKTKTLASMPLYSNNICYDYENNRWEIRIPTSKDNRYIPDDDYFNSEAFKEFRSDKSWLTLEYIRKKFEEKKNQFNQAGFATYQDIENTCYKLLGEGSELAQLIAERFPLIIVDECQDLSWIQLHIFKRLIDVGAHIHFIGDLNQGIYAFKKVYPQKVKEFIDRNDFKIFELSRNFRSIQPIVDLCGRLIAQGDIKGESPSENHDPACVCFTYNKNEIQKIVDRFVSYLKQRKIPPEKCAIVARGYSTVDKLRPGAAKIPEKKALWLPTAIHLWENNSAESMSEALNCIGRFVSKHFFQADSTNSRAYYCPESVSSQIRWRLLLAQILDRCVKSETLRNLNQTWSEWAKAVREQFENVVRSCSRIELPYQNNRNFSFRALQGASTKTVISTLETVEKSNVSDILITTFHKVKGQTFDAILVVSAPDKRGDGGHWSQWIDVANTDDEHARFAYVASSRPKFLLGCAVPSPTEEEKKRLEKLGFTICIEAGEKP